MRNCDCNVSHSGYLKHTAMESVHGMTKWCNSWFLRHTSLVLQMEAFKRKQATSSSQNVSFKYSCNFIWNNTELCPENVTTNRYLFPYLCLTYPPHLEEFPSFFHHQLLPCTLLLCLVAYFQNLLLGQCALWLNKFTLTCKKESVVTTDNKWTRKLCLCVQLQTRVISKLMCYMQI